MFKNKSPYYEWVHLLVDKKNTKQVKKPFSDSEGEAEQKKQHQWWGFDTGKNNMTL